MGHKQLQSTTAIVRVVRPWWPTALGLSLLVVYLYWNIRWIAVGRIPPSMLTSATGLPCPTTGGTRSVLALLHGELALSLYYNPMTLPILALLAVTVAQVLLKGRGENWLVAAWTGTLALAWVVKLLSPPETW